MSAELAGSVAVVTGGAKGIGRAIATELARSGADLVLVGRDREALDRAAAELRAMGRRACGVAADVTVPEEVARVSARIREEFAGQVDVVVTAAGQRDHFNRPLDELAPADFDLVMKGNVNGTLLPIRELAPLMKARRRGKVVMISGVFGLKGSPRHGASCASKWAIEGLLRVLALELGPFNVNVNAVCPGYVVGPRSDAGIARAAAARGVEEKALRAELEGGTALKRLSTAEDVANAVSFLVSERARNITGRDLVVDAGWTL